MNTQPTTHKTRLARKAVVLLTAFALLAAACSGSETAVEPTTTLADTTIDADTGTDTDTADAVGVDDDVGDGETNPLDSTLANDGDELAPYEPAVSGGEYDADKEGALNDDDGHTPDDDDGLTPDDDDGLTPDDDDGLTPDDDDGLTPDDDDGHTPVTGTQQIIADSETEGGLTPGEVEAERFVEQAEQKAIADPAPREQVETNVGPDGLTYDPTKLEITERSGTIHTHRWGSEYFLAKRTHSSGKSYDAWVFVGIREPLDEVFYVDYTPQPNAERRDAEGRVWVNQWLSSTIPIVDNLDLRVRNTITGEIEHWRVFNWEERGPNAGAAGGRSHTQGEIYREATPETQRGDSIWSRQVYSCHYATDGVEFPPGEGRAWVRVAVEIETERGSEQPSGRAWVTYNNNHSGWQGFC